MAESARFSALLIFHSFKLYRAIGVERTERERRQAALVLWRSQARRPRRKATSANTINTVRFCEDWPGRRRLQASIMLVVITTTTIIIIITTIIFIAVVVLVFWLADRFVFAPRETLLDASGRGAGEGTSRRTRRRRSRRAQEAARATHSHAHHTEKNSTACLLLSALLLLLLLLLAIVRFIILGVHPLDLLISRHGQLVFALLCRRRRRTAPATTTLLQ